MIQLATNIAEHQTAIAYFSLEFSTEILTQKLLSNLAQVSPETFARPGEYNNQIEEKLSFAIRQLKQMPIYFYENPSTHINKLVRLISNIVLEKNVKVVFIDYLQLMSIGSRRINRDVEMSIICRTLKNLAKELEITIIAGSQLSRQVENRIGGSRRPQLSDLRESGSIEQDADKVFLLYRPEYYGLEVDENNQPTINKMEIMLSKNRSGPICDFMVTALFGKSIIVDIEDYEDKRYIKSSEINISSNRLKDFEDPTNDVF
jgi:replicative DNA helicase